MRVKSAVEEFASWFLWDKNLKVKRLVEELSCSGWSINSIGRAIHLSVDKTLVKQGSWFRKKGKKVKRQGPSQLARMQPLPPWMVAVLETVEYNELLWCTQTSGACLWCPATRYCKYKQHWSWALWWNPWCAMERDGVTLLQWCMFCRCWCLVSNLNMLHAILLLS